MEPGAQGFRAVLRRRHLGRFEPHHAAGVLRCPEGSQDAQHARRHQPAAERQRAGLKRARLPLRRPEVGGRAHGGGGDIQPLHLLARRGAHTRGKARRSSAHLRADALLRQPPGALRRGDRSQRRGFRQLPAGLHAPDPHKRRLQPRPGARKGEVVVHAAETKNGWIDVSVSLHSGMVHWPDNPPVRIERALSIEIRDPESIKPHELYPYELQRGERVLFKTQNSARRWSSEDFIEDFVYVSQEAARYLAERGIQTVGVDYLSVGGFLKDGVETHRALLEAGIWVIEGLDLSEVEPGEYELICLPVKIERSDGAPARALLRAI